MEKIYKLGEIFQIRSGYTPDTRKKEYWCSHKEKCDCVPWFTGKDITEKKVLNTERKITPLAVREYSMNLTTENSVLFNYLECSPYYLGIKGISCQGGGGGTHILEPNLELVYPNYLYYLLLSIKNKLRTWRSGTRQVKIRGQELVELSISLPSLQEQNQILQKFQIVYDKIFKSEIVYNNRLLEIIKTILEYADLLFLKYKDSQIRIKDCFKLVRGKTPPTKNPEYYENGTIKWINSGVLTNLYFLTEYTQPSKLVTEKAVKECQLFYAQPNTVLFSDIDLNPEKIVWTMEQKNEDWETDGTHVWTLLGTHVWTLLGTDVCENSVLFFALRQVDFSAYASGSIIRHLQGSALLNMKINWVSNPKKQKLFFTILNSKLAKIKDLHSQIKDLHSQIKDLLLLKYFGKK